MTYLNSSAEDTNFCNMKNPIKITYMIDYLDTNLAGTENQIIKMINGIDSTRFKVNLICLRTGPWIKANMASIKCKIDILEINKFKKPSTYFNFVRLVRLFKDRRPDIVHTFFPVCNVIGVLAARIAGVSCILSSRRDYGEWMSRHYLWATRFANRFVTCIVANSTQVKDLTIKKEGLNSDRIKVIYNGIDTEKFRNIRYDNKLKRELGIPDANKIIGIIANFRPMKHHYTFIKAAEIVLRQRQDITFILIGTGQLKGEMEKLVKSLGIEKCIIFAGQRNDITRFLSIMNIGVNCSEGEGLSNAIMEYMSTGIVCVVSDAAGNPDLITNNVNGFVFRLDDYEQLAELILTALSNKSLCEKLIKKSFEKIESEMSLVAILSEYESFYEGLVQ